MLKRFHHGWLITLLVFAVLVVVFSLALYPQWRESPFLLIVTGITGSVIVLAALRQLLEKDLPSKVSVNSPSIATAVSDLFADEQEQNDSLEPVSPTFPDEPVDEGYLDWLAGKDEALNQLSTCWQNLTLAVNKFNSKIDGWHIEWNRLQSESTDNWIAQRDIVNASAADVKELADSVSIQVPLCHQASTQFEQCMGSLLRNLKLSQDFLMREQRSVLLMQTTKSRFISNLQQYKENIQRLGGHTSELNRASRQAVSILDDLLSELEAIQVVYETILKELNKRIAENS